MLQSTNNLVAEYNRLLPECRDITKIVDKLLKDAIEKSGFSPMQCSHRIKNRASFREKLLRKGDKYENILDITDIVGFRILFYYSDQVDLFADVIEDLFVVDRARSIDKRQSLAANSFGYISLHFICTLPEDRGYPEGLCRIPFEIQLRSVLQHTWAEIEHNLGYKTSYSVPRNIEREFARIAGLLEIADERFVALRRQIDEYTEQAHRDIAMDRGDELMLDLVTLTEFLAASPIIRSIISDITNMCNVSVRAGAPEPYLPRLFALGMQTIGDLKAVFIREREAILARAERLLKNSEIDEVVSTACLYYLCQILERKKR